MSVDSGLEKLEAEGSKYKIDNARRAVEAGSDQLSWYATGEPGSDWEDLCRGPHVPSTGRIGAFKVMSVASSNQRLREAFRREVPGQGAPDLPPCAGDRDAHQESSR